MTTVAAGRGMTASVATQVLEICRQALEDATVGPDATTETVQTWDSLGHMKIIAALEAHFGVELDVMEMAEVDGVPALVEVVERTLRSGS